jgi:hypothetical protein
MHTFLHAFSETHSEKPNALNEAKVFRRPSSSCTRKHSGIKRALLEQARTKIQSEKISVQCACQGSGISVEELQTYLLGK